MIASLAAERASAGDDPFHEVYAFADQVISERPPGSPLALLPLVAHLERFRVLVAAGLLAPDRADSRYWTSPRARHGLRIAFDWWLDGTGRDYSRYKSDLNYLAYAKVRASRWAEAAVLFNAIGPHATREPWAYGGADPADAFRTDCAQALGMRG
jgi:hypothetical protein